MNQQPLFALQPPPMKPDRKRNTEPESAPVLVLERRRRRRTQPSPPPVDVVPERLPPIPSRGPLGVVDQVRLALRPGSRLAFALGSFLGAVVPFVTFHYSHTEIDLARPLWLQPRALFVLGGLTFSAVTMYGWGKMAFLQKTKALGFVLLMEGTMVTTRTHWLALVALAYLCAINAVATACNLARPPERAE